MADQSDVENALVNLVSGSLYPNGTDAASLPGPDCRIYRGWPSSAALDKDLSAGTINVTVFPGSGAGRTTTRYAEQWVGSPAEPSLTAEVAGTSVTFGGTAESGQIAGILVDSRSYAYRIQTGDTPELVAANLAAMARDNSVVQLSGSIVTIAGAGSLEARIVADAPAKQEVRRQEQDFRISCWCPTPASSRCCRRRDRPVVEQHPLPRSAGRNAGPVGLFGNYRVRPIAECQSVSPGSYVQRGIRHDTFCLAARDAVRQPRAQCHELHCLNIWRLY